MNNKKNLPPINKPLNNTKLISESDIISKQYMERINKLKKDEENRINLYTIDKINHIKNMKKNNPAILKMKKQIELKKILMKFIKKLKIIIFVFI